jgi:hypothetical protein
MQLLIPPLLLLLRLLLGFRQPRLLRGVLRVLLLQLLQCPAELS